MTTLIKTNPISLAYLPSHVGFLHENQLIEGEKMSYCVFTAGITTIVLVRLFSFTIPADRVLLCCLSRQSG